jgi:hypothetical protein
MSVSKCLRVPLSAGGSAGGNGVEIMVEAAGARGTAGVDVPELMVDRCGSRRHRGRDTHVIWRYEFQP